MKRKVLLIFLFINSLLCFSQQKNIANVNTTPNPFVNNTLVTFNSFDNRDVIFEVKNILGKTVFKKGYRAVSGKNSIYFERNDLKSGMYIYSIQTNKEIIAKRFVIR